MRQLDNIMISHETPVSILEDSMNFNDYQYCLVHLCDEVEEYRDWFTGKFRAKQPEGEILLDNSIFELREAFDAEILLFGLKRFNLIIMSFLTYLKVMKVL